MSAITADPAGAAVAPPAVMTFDPPSASRPVSAHTRRTTQALAARIAALKGLAYAGEYDGVGNSPGPVYLVPSRTVVGQPQGLPPVRSEHDLFGGIVPHPFVSTKVISHPLPDQDRPAPEGWSHAFADAVREVTLPGFAAFDPATAIDAGRRVLERGPARVKRASADGGHGQVVVHDARGLAAAIEALDPVDLGRTGLIIEENLDGTVETLSVGRVLLGDCTASYWGWQITTRDNEGGLAYGGSTLRLVRGDLETLLRSAMPPAARAAVMQACRYDAAATAHFPGLIASRRNYDVIRGTDVSGQTRSAVLEQSWRLGGASGAEILAVEAMLRDPTLPSIEASTREVYGRGPVPPPGAIILFQDDDPEVGWLTKYAVLETPVI